MKSVCVFCGSNPGSRPEFAAAARETGAALAQRKLDLVYGGGHRGMMGTVADAALDSGGRVHGVITEFLRDKELMHQRIQVCDVVADMAVRKDRMAQLSDAFFVLPGGVGTLEELFDMWSRNQLSGFPDRALKPIGILNVGGFFTPLLHMIDSMVQGGYVPRAQTATILVDTNAHALLDQLAAFTPTASSKWF